jgi:7-dehydrocholesterol reductase
VSGSFFSWLSLSYLRDCSQTSLPRAIEATLLKELFNLLVGVPYIYLINGLQAWLLTHLSFLLLELTFGVAETIYSAWTSTLLLSIIFGDVAAVLVFIKGRLFPNSVVDLRSQAVKRMSGWMDFFSGIEISPRIRVANTSVYPYLDLKLFFNSHYGMISWTLVNLMYAVVQREVWGSVTSPMLLVNFLHLLYVLYFFWKEAWYLNTLDMMHDRFGWMLVFGVCVWVPFVYTSQCWYLLHHPEVELSQKWICSTLLLGLVGFYIFVSSNNQKDYFKQLPTHKQQEMGCLTFEFTTADGERHFSRFLVSGWWGLARHSNYTGDLLFSWATGLACGTESLWPYLYPIYMTILLVHRCYRDENRCRDKYGDEQWNRYCRKVPYRLIPYVF